MGAQVQDKIKCIICSDKNGMDVFFEGISWYHCPRCNQHGFASIYDNCCTGCANKVRCLN